jgi:dethiobiotin synthetase
MKRYFVTGTDTGVGKTHVAAALARRSRELGRRVCAFKPIETGCEGELGPDQRLLIEVAGGWQTGPTRGLYQLRLPAAPLVAARAESVEIALSRIEEAVRSILADVVLVEGAGGWRVPITEADDMGALARRLALPVIVVARAGLGTINHSLLTIEAVERDGCAIAAVILSKRPSEDPSFAASNRDEIHRRWPGPVVVLGKDSLDWLL